MKTLAFSGRTAKEILRDPLNLCIGLGFPLAVLMLLSAFRDAPGGMFAPENLAPGIFVFGSSFMSLFTANLVAKDRETTFLERLYTAPLSPVGFIVGYSLPMIPIAICQHIICIAASAAMGLGVSIKLILSLIMNIPVELMFIALGLMCGSLLTPKQVGGVCGALLTNLCVWLSGAWMPLEVIGGVFEKVCHALPFYHAVELQRVIFSEGEGRTVHFAIVLGYTVLLLLIAIAAFFRQMRK